jgi:hypothetical protein
MAAEHYGSMNGVTRLQVGVPCVEFDGPLDILAARGKQHRYDPEEEAADFDGAWALA